jgi:hypothetical protein
MTEMFVRNIKPNFFSTDTCFQKRVHHSADRLHASQLNVYFIAAWLLQQLHAYFAA